MKHVLLSLLLSMSSFCCFAKNEVRMDGEVVALKRSSLLPPAIDELWNLTLTQLAPDGEPIKRGQPAVSFDGSEVMKRLQTKQSELAEKKTQREKLKLELAERTRTDKLATQEQQSRTEKAQRKATQPASLVRRIDYQKFVIDKKQSERLLALARQREILVAQQRQLEWQVVESETQNLEADVQQLQIALTTLNVMAPQNGLMQHQANWQGEKFAVGTQVFRGQEVAGIADLSSLAVRAQLNERDYTRVSLNARVKITVEGSAGTALSGQIVEIGRAVRSKSRTQPIPVIDVLIRLDKNAYKIKPGQTVRVELINTKKAAP
jgi:HlyD family secretion protein